MVEAIRGQLITDSPRRRISLRYATTSYIYIVAYPGRVLINWELDPFALRVNWRGRGYMVSIFDTLISNWLLFDMKTVFVFEKI